MDETSKTAGTDSSGSPHPSATFGEGTLEYGVAGEVSLRWAATNLTAVVEEARRRHDLSPLAAVALGRAMAGATLLHRLSLKATRRLTLTVAGDGPLGRIVAEVNQDGDLRGFVGEAHLDLPTDAEGRLRIAEAVGQGMLKVRRELADGTSYESQVALESGEIGLDLAHFLEQSEQTQSAVLVGVLEGPEGVRAAGGLLVEVLPDAQPAAIEKLEANLAADASISRTLEHGGLTALRERVFTGLAAELLDRRSLRFNCGCDRERLLEQLSVLAAADLEEIRADDGAIVAECAFCSARYRFTSDEMALR